MSILKQDDYDFIRRECRTVLLRKPREGESSSDLIVNDKGFDFIADWGIRKYRKQLRDKMMSIQHLPPEQLAKELLAMLL